MLTIQSHSHPYTVFDFGSFREATAHAAGASNAFWLVDERVAALHAEAFQDVPEERRLLIAASEEAKSYEKLGPVFEAMLGAGFRRNSTLIVVGGGVLQDIGCFVASVLQRGVRWVLIPTTLLAQCDSCIGSKSSINIGSYKNQLGTFYPPHEVLLCPSVLDSLPAEDVHSGLGEAIKLHLLDSEASTARIKSELANLEADSGALATIIGDSLRIKQRFIEEDEFDRGIRRLLNYGHTFAHAYESATHYGIPHGIAVTLGILSATYFSAQLGLVPVEHFEELKSLLRPYHAPYEARLTEVEVSAVLGAMKLDKKNQTDGITFVLTRGPGRMELMTLPREQVTALLPECLQALQATG